MKLYEVYLDNGMYYEDSYEMSILIVAQNQEEADIRSKELLHSEMGHWMDEERARFNAYEINKVDGYTINVGELLDEHKSEENTDCKKEEPKNSILW